MKYTLAKVLAFISNCQIVKEKSAFHLLQNDICTYISILNLGLCEHLNYFMIWNIILPDIFEKYYDSLAQFIFALFLLLISAIETFSFFLQNICFTTLATNRRVQHPKDGIISIRTDIYVKFLRPFISLYRSIIWKLSKKNTLELFELYFYFDLGPWPLRHWRKFKDMHCYSGKKPY